MNTLEDAFLNIEENILNDEEESNLQLHEKIIDFSNISIPESLKLPSD